MRKTVSKFLSLSLIYLMLLSVIGSCLCAAAAETAYPITVTDQSGREVTIEKNRNGSSVVTIFRQVF